MYQYVIFDADHTLIDFNSDERAAFGRTFSRFGIRFTEEDIHRAWVLSYTVWDEQGLNDLNSEYIRANFHKKYVSHLPILFSRIKEGLPTEATAEKMAAIFLDELNAPAKILGNALEIFKECSRSYRTCIATNGLSVMQRARLCEFLPHAYAVFVSEEMQAIKPAEEFFSGMFSSLGTGAEKCLFVGDSLTSDIAGANAVGMDCVWFNRSGKSLPAQYKVKGQIDDLEKVRAFL